VIADRAYDSDPLRERLKKRGIELIVPYRSNKAQALRRWPQAAPLQTPLDHRTNQRLARPIPTIARSS
jgi:hypothetical protein